MNPFMACRRVVPLYDYNEIEHFLPSVRILEQYGGVAVSTFDASDSTQSLVAKSRIPVVGDHHSPCVVT